MSSKVNLHHVMTLGPYAVHVWSRNTLKFGGNDTLVLHRANVPSLVQTSNHKFELPGIMSGP